jgi:hypothetical protein
VTEPEIIGFGRYHVQNYTESELTACLWRAFIRDSADYVMLDDYPANQRFVAASCSLAVDRGWFSHTETRGDEQSRVHVFRLTAAGKTALKAFKP